MLSVIFCYFYLFYIFFLFFFFFSSRRRHTRLVSDWSSDVCSSDLTPELTHRTLTWGDPPYVPVCTEFRSEEHTSELQSLTNLVCRLLLEKKKKTNKRLQIMQHKLT